MVVSRITPLVGIPCRAAVSGPVVVCKLADALLCVLDKLWRADHAHTCTVLNNVQEPGHIQRDAIGHPQLGCVYDGASTSRRRSCNGDGPLLVWPALSIRKMVVSRITPLVGIPCRAAVSGPVVVVKSADALLCVLDVSRRADHEGAMRVGYDIDVAVAKGDLRDPFPVSCNASIAAGKICP